jgi:hypothetical protein
MLNLSDNELDRLSREAASQHDPGDLMGHQAWDRLELRLDKELGRAGPEVSRGVRGIRRLPFQFAPMILLIVGASYYFIKQSKERQAGNSGSPPLTVVKTPQQQPGKTASDPSIKNPDYSDKSTSTPYHQDQSQNTELSDSISGEVGAHMRSGASAMPSGAPTTPSGTSISPSGTLTTPSSNSTAHNHTSAKPSGSSNNPSGASVTPPGTLTTHNHTSAKPSGALTTPSRTSNLSPDSFPAPANSLTAPASSLTASASKKHHDLASQTHSGGHGRSSNHIKRPKPTDPNTASGVPADLTTAASTNASQNPSANASLNASPNPSSDPSKSFIQKPHSLRNHPFISDSALRAYTAQTPVNPGKKSGPSLRINRSLTFGLQLSPDFSSVNSLAGDKPGSTIGLTIDYRFLNRWHIGTGLFFSKKNYTARATDYHEPYHYYQTVGLKDVDFIKGTMRMMEIPIDLRYDFSVAGNTVFFASGGVSTYLFGKENCNYYYDFFGREICREFQYDNKHSFLSTANLSLGVETGISNDFSLMIAPYMKLPLSNVGFGNIRMSSVGINLALRFAPVISRKRQH